MDEIWKEIEGYDGDYIISNFGKVKSLRFNKRIPLKQIKHSRGYLVVNLFKNKIPKKFLLHRLVAENFIENPENKPEVNHLNGDKSNNHISNLEWATYSENTKHAWKTGLMENTRKAVKKNAIIATEARKKQIFSSKLNIYFESTVEAAIYLQNNYFENTTLGCLKTSIFKLLNNKVTKSKFDFGWEYQ